MNKLEVLRAIQAGGFARDLRLNDDFATFLATLDQLESEGMVEGVQRYRDPDDAHVISVRIARLTDTGMSYVNAMSGDSQ